MEDQGEEDHSDSESVLLQHFVVILCSSSIILLHCVRPPDRTYCLFSGLLSLAPFYGHLAWLKHHTALDTILEFNWLPVGNHALDSLQIGILLVLENLPPSTTTH